jgi:predicted membrane chloride channel (bestrophin family)
MTLQAIKPREVALRNWMALANGARASIPAVLIVAGASAAVGVLPSWVTIEALMILSAIQVGAVALAVTLANRRFNAMTREWGSRRLACMGIRPGELALEDGE